MKNFENDIFCPQKFIAIKNEKSNQVLSDPVIHVKITLHELSVAKNVIFFELKHAPTTSYVLRIITLIDLHPHYERR